MVLFLHSKQIRILTLLLATLILFYVDNSVAMEKNKLQVKQFPGIDFRNGLLKVSVENESLKDVMDDVSRKAGIKIIVNFSTEEEMTVSFDYLPLENGVRRLLKGYDYALMYCSEEEDSAKDPSRLMTIYVFTKLEGPVKERLHEDVRQVMNMEEIQNKINSSLRKIITSQDFDKSSVLQKTQIEEALRKINEMGGFDKLKNIENENIQSLDTVKKDIMDKIDNAINGVAIEPTGINDKE